ncbi:MAG: hypothetical protein ABI743_00460 [bacterium]
MSSSVHRATRVGEDGRIELEVPEFPPGTEVAIFIWPFDVPSVSTPEERARGFQSLAEKMRAAARPDLTEEDILAEIKAHRAGK